MASVLFLDSSCTAYLVLLVSVFGLFAVHQTSDGFHNLWGMPPLRGTCSFQFSPFLTCLVRQIPSLHLYRTSGVLCVCELRYCLLSTFSDWPGYQAFGEDELEKAHLQPSPIIASTSSKLPLRTPPAHSGIPETNSTVSITVAVESMCPKLTFLNIGGELPHCSLPYRRDLRRPTSPFFSNLFRFLNVVVGSRLVGCFAPSWESLSPSWEKPPMDHFTTGTLH